MKKGIIIIVAVVMVVLAIVAILIFKSEPNEVGYHDGTIGKIVFNKVGAEVGYGIDGHQGEFPMDVEITEGKLNLKITRAGKIIFEQSDIDTSQKLVATLPDDGGYLISLSGKKASGTINYPVINEEGTSTLDDMVDSSNNQ